MYSGLCIERGSDFIVGRNGCLLFLGADLSHLGLLKTVQKINNIHVNLIVLLSLLAKNDQK